MITEKEFLRSDMAVLKHQLAERHQRLLSVVAEEYGLEWEQLSDRLAILHNPQKRSGWSQMGYIGFTTKQDAEKCAKVLHAQKLFTGLEIRKAKRLKTCRWEIKAMDIHPEVLRRLSHGDIEDTQQEAWPEAHAGGRQESNGNCFQLW